MASHHSTALFLIVLAVIALSGCAKPVRVEGTAMMPAFQDGDRLLMTSEVNDLKRFDVIYFKYPRDETKFYLKRIIGLPGEHVEIRQGHVFINGKEITEAYLDPKYNASDVSFPEKTLSHDQYFVLGDNRDNSSDSRYWGPVAKSLIVGKYYSTYYTSKPK